VRFEESVTIPVPRARVWALVADPLGYPGLLDWFTAFVPEDADRPPGVGARYRMRVRAGSAEVGGLVEITEYDEGRDVVWTAVSGIEQRGRIRLRDADGGTLVLLRASYGAPGALLGTLSELVAAPQVRGEIRRSLESLARAATGRERPAPRGPGLPGRLAHEAVNVGLLARAGLVALMRPDKVARLALAAARWGASPATAIVAGAIRHPGRTLLADDEGELTYAEVDRRTSAVARGLAAEAGVGPGDRVGILCRDGRAFVEALLGVAKLGADAVLLNPSFAAPQITDVCRREDVASLIVDEDLLDLTRGAARGRARVLGWRAPDSRRRGPSLEALAAGESEPLEPPPAAGGVTILTSGTTGAPKGATRGAIPLTLDPAAALLERIPLREGQVVRVAAPLFHAWGFANLLLGMALGDTLVLRRRFDPEGCLADVEAHRCEALVVVPVMLGRILALPPAARSEHDTSSLRAVSASGSAVPGDLSTRWMDAFGDRLYNVYGSTEVSAATIATPEDLRHAPGTAGRPARGCVVRLYDEAGRPVLQGETGRIFVGNALLFEGYTGGGSKDRLDGLMATGDVGHFDAAGRLFVDGRDDDMVVSGGENVFPQEVEEALMAHPAVAEAAVVGVPDEEFGQRLRAFVVPADGEPVTPEELRDHVRARLARFKVPREVVLLDALPRTGSGKVLKRELAERPAAAGGATGSRTRRSR
jgi:fatty-acyl-CoA synthase